MDHRAEGMDPTEALRHLRVLIEIALEAQEIEVIYKLLENMRAIAEKAEVVGPKS